MHLSNHQTLQKTDIAFNNKNVSLFAAYAKVGSMRVTCVHPVAYPIISVVIIMASFVQRSSPR